MFDKLLDNKMALSVLMASAYVGGVIAIAGGFYAAYQVVTWIGASP